MITTTILAVLIVLLLALLANPFMLWMPSVLLVSVLSATVVLLLIWMAFILTEHARDEREESNRTFSGRAAYLAAAGVLILAILVQGFEHLIDPWIPAVLAAMVVAKTAARIYTDRYR